MVPWSTLNDIRLNCPSVYSISAKSGIARLEIIMDDHKLHFKEVSAAETIFKLKEIANNLGITFSEKWQNESSLGTWSVRITLEGTHIGSNGKGVSKEYCTASAYAEFFERFQNNRLGNTVALGFDDGYKFVEAIDEKWLSAEELLSGRSAFFDTYFALRKATAVDRRVKEDMFKEVQTGDFISFGLDNQYLSIPFYSIKNKDITYLPKCAYSLPYGSNGMSAGNTIAEAVVQGLSEIVERYVQKTIILDKVTPPDIPYEYISRFPYIDRMYKKLQENPNYICMLKDCSLGQRFPVAALVILEKNTGKYGIKLGCHPSYPVAMERAFTEATQGQDVYQYTNRSIFDFNNENVNESMNVYNTYKIGFGQYPYEFFSDEYSYEFVEPEDVSDKSNADLMFQWCDDFISQGYDILIRNVSYLGFPSIHIIIPGFSEMFDVTDQWYRVYNTHNFASKQLMRPEAISETDAKFISGAMDFLTRSVLENAIETYYPWARLEDLPFAGAAAYGTKYLSALARAVHGDYHGAAKRMRSILPIYANENILSKIQENGAKLPSKEFILAAYHYFSGLGNGLEVDQSLHYVRLFFSSEVINQIEATFNSFDNCIATQYPQCNADYGISKQVEVYRHLLLCLKKAQTENPIDQKDYWVDFFEKQKRLTFV